MSKQAHHLLFTLTLLATSASSLAMGEQQPQSGADSNAADAAVMPHPALVTEDDPATLLQRLREEALQQLMQRLSTGDLLNELADTALDAALQAGKQLLSSR